MFLVNRELVFHFYRCKKQTSHTNSKPFPPPTRGCGSKRVRLTLALHEFLLSNRTRSATYRLGHDHVTIADAARFSANVVPQMKRTTIAKEFEAKQANAAGTLDRTLGAEAPLAATLGGAGGATSADWQGSGTASDQFASKDEVGELRQAVAMKVRHMIVFVYPVPPRRNTHAYVQPKKNNSIQDSTLYNFLPIASSMSGYTNHRADRLSKTSI